jgi:hypothetical protein
VDDADKNMQRSNPFISIVDNFPEGLRVEARASHQQPVDVLLRHE